MTLLPSLFSTGLFTLHTLHLNVTGGSPVVDPDFGTISTSTDTVTARAYFKKLSEFKLESRPDGVPNSAVLVRAYLQDAVPDLLVSNSKCQVDVKGWFVYSRSVGLSSTIATEIVGLTLEGYYWPND